MITVSKHQTYDTHLGVNPWNVSSYSFKLDSFTRYILPMPPISSFPSLYKFVSFLYFFPVALA